MTMNTLTPDMSRLRQESDALRHARETFINDLRTYAGNLKQMASSMRCDFRSARAERTEHLKSTLRGFADNLRQNVRQLRDGFVADISGAHGAWGGASSAGNDAGKVARRNKARSNR